MSNPINQIEVPPTSVVESISFELRPPVVKAALDEHCRQMGISHAEAVRQLVLKGLDDRGFDVTQWRQRAQELRASLRREGSVSPRLGKGLTPIQDWNLKLDDE